MIKVAIVGTGNIAPSHVEGLLTFKDRCQIVALVDIYPEKAHELMEEYHLDCWIYADYKQMLEEIPDLDLVHVCTPPYLHSEISLAAMNRGCHVLVEKPMAPSLEECDAMLEAEAINEVILSSVAQNRFRNPVYRLKKLVDSGIAGRPRMIQVDSLWWRGHSYYDLWWRGLWEKEGGGVTLNHAVHHIDMLNWIQKGLPREVSSVLANVNHDNAEVEDLSLSTLIYEDGSLAQVTGSVIHHGEDQGLSIQCERAKLSAPWSVSANSSKENGFPYNNENLESQLNILYNEFIPLKYTGHTGQIEDLLSAIENKGQPLISGRDGRHTVELITAIYKSGICKERVILPLDSNDEFYKSGGVVNRGIRFNRKSKSVENFAKDKISTGDEK